MNMKEEEVDSEDEFLDKRSVGAMSEDTEIVFDEFDLSDDEDGVWLSGEEKHVVKKLLLPLLSVIPDSYTDFVVPEITPELRVAAWIQKEFGNVAEVPNRASSTSTSSMADGSLDIEPEPALATNTSKEVKFQKKAPNSAKYKVLKRKTKCNICNLKFSNVDAHRKYAHCTNEEKEALKHQCTICGKKVRCLDSHMNCRHSVKSSKDKNQQSKAGSKMKHGSYRKKCNICNLKFCHLDDHRKYAHCTAEEKEALKHQCTICKKKVRYLDIHMKCRHSVNRNKKSSQQHSVKSSKNKTQPKSNKAGPEMEQGSCWKMKCNICNLKFFNLELHRQNVHCTAKEAETPKQQRTICEKKFRVLASHMKFCLSSNAKKKTNQQRKKTKQCSICSSQISVKNFRRHEIGCHGTANEKAALKANRRFYILKLKKQNAATARVISRNENRRSPNQQRKKTKQCSICSSKISVKNFRRHEIGCHGTADEKAALKANRRNYGLKRNAATPRVNSMNENRRSKNKAVGRPKNRKKKCPICDLSFVNLALHKRSHSTAKQVKAQKRQSTNKAVTTKPRSLPCGRMKLRSFVSGEEERSEKENDKTVHHLQQKVFSSQCVEPHD